MKLICYSLIGRARLLVCLFCVVNYYLPNVTSALQINSPSQLENKINKSLSLVNSLLQPFSSVCIESRNKEFLEVFIKYYYDKKTTFTLFETGKTSTYYCESIVMLDVVLSTCGDITVNKFNCALYFLSSTTTNITLLEKCFQNSSLPELVIVSLQDNSWFQLSSIFPFPRSFTKSSFEEVINHRSNRYVDNFRGSSVAVAFVNYPPYVIVRKKADDTFKLDGIQYLLICELSRKLNFSLQYQVYNSWGLITRNKTWKTGIGWAMQKRLAQLAFCGMWQLHPFHALFDFGPSMAMVTGVFFVRRPEQIQFNWKEVIRIFKPIVWYSAAASFTLISAFYWFGIIRIHPSYREDWICSVVTVFGHFTMSTSHTYVSDHFTRLVLTSWSVLSLLLTTFLSTGIVSSLTLPLYSPRVDSVRQMVEGGYSWSTQFYRDFESIELKGAMFDLEDHWQYLFEKKYTYMTGDEIRAAGNSNKKIVFPSQVYNNDIVIMQTYGFERNEALKKYRVAKEWINKGHVSFGVEKSSPMLELLSRMTLKYLEAGLQNQWMDAVLQRWPEFNTRHLLDEKDVPTFGQPEMMHITKLRPLFYLVLAGMVIAFIIFCLEILCY